MVALPQVAADEIGLRADLLERAYDLLHKGTEGSSRKFPGAALLVGRHEKSVAPRFFGRQGPEPDAEPIRRDGTFLLASITKPVTYITGLMMVERGLVNLSDPVTKYIPDFAAHHKENVQVGHLFTHTSGMPDMLEKNIELRRQHAPLEAFISGAILDTMPLFPAGTNLSYQSMGTLIVAEIVQRLSGMRIRDFMQKEIFGPLGLKSTGLDSSELERETLVRVGIPAAQVGKDYNWNSRYWQELGAPWGGMFSSPEDLAVLCQLMLNGGHYGGVRLLSRSTVEMMTRNELDYLPDLPEPIRRTQPWGLGWKLNQPFTLRPFTDLRGSELYGHGGATGTMVWIDPPRQGFCVLLTTRNNWDYLVQVSNAVAAAFEE